MSGMMMMNGMGMGMSMAMVLACLLVLLVLVLVAAASIKYLFFHKVRRDLSSTTGGALVDSPEMRRSPAAGQQTKGSSTNESSSAHRTDGGLRIAQRAADDVSNAPSMQK